MSALPSDLRKQLEKVCIQARDRAEDAARSALKKRAVDAAEPFSHFTPSEKELRNRLRARGRQVGDVRQANKTQSLDHLMHELAYQYWHRMIFARFLAENHLLMHPDGVAVSLEECEELARSENAPNGYVLAARYASRMLPQVFRTDDVLLEVEFAPEQRLALEKELAKLPTETFLADDSLGWVYQFWQTKKKEEVNAAGNKIGADELPSVTQLFTEDYMVDFLLDNTLGAWHAGKVLAANPKLSENAQSEDELRKVVALPGCPWKYLRFITGEDGNWRPAAGTFDGWPKTANELKCLDPCMGSGHFVVAMFERLVTLRMAEEKLDEAAAVAAVIRDNLFGLEIDPRCTQIGAFNLALAAWRRVGYRPLPGMNLACSGIAPNTRESDWLKMAGDNQRLQYGMARLYELFQKAAVLGSLINPRAGEGNLLVAAFHELEPVLEKALVQEAKDDTAHEMAVTARGLAKAAEILADQFTLVATNVPYLGRGKQDDTLKNYIEKHHPKGKADLATAFVERCLEFCAKDGTTALVTPQNWLFLTTYTKLRESLLNSRTWNVVARLGSNAFQDMNWWAATTTLLVLNYGPPSVAHEIIGIDVSNDKQQSAKASMLRGDVATRIAVGRQVDQLKNPDARLTIEARSALPELRQYVEAPNGSHGGDAPRHRLCFWEMHAINSEWRLFQGTVEETQLYSGREHIFSWFNDGLDHRENPNAYIKGENVIGRLGVVVSMMRTLPATLFCGELFDISCTPLVPVDSAHLLPVWAYCSSQTYRDQVRQIDQKVNVTNATLAKVPFDLAYWQQVAAEKYPDGLPEPESDDSTQWLFHGRPESSTAPLQVTVARLLGYRWPAELDQKMGLSKRARDLVRRCEELLPLADRDGLVPIPSVRGETHAAERLLELLHAAYGPKWSNSMLHELLTEANCPPGTTLDDWLRNSFFEQHCKLFHNRPFIWHIWDGRKDGFSCLVNYHKLNYKTLENLTYSYLGDWIKAQAGETKAGKTGADLRLGAAQALQEKLKLILAGEPPYDIFVRWKPLSQQAIGWHPDLNDGVRMNIRPFVEADILRKTPSIKWGKDRGKEPGRGKDEYPWFYRGQTFVGDRVNDIHLTNAEKQAARVQPNQNRER